MANSRVVYIRYGKNSHSISFNENTTLHEIKQMAFNNAGDSNNKPDDFLLILSGKVIDVDKATSVKLSGNTPFVRAVAQYNLRATAASTMHLVVDVNKQKSHTPSTSTAHSPAVLPSSSSSSTTMIARPKTIEVKFGYDSFQIDANPFTTINDIIKQVLERTCDPSLSQNDFQLITKTGWSLGTNKNQTLHNVLDTENTTSPLPALQLIKVVKQKVRDPYRLAEQKLVNPSFAWVPFKKEITEIKKDEKDGIIPICQTFGQAFFKTIDSALKAYTIDVAENLIHAKNGFDLLHTNIRTPSSIEALLKSLQKSHSPFPLLLECSENDTVYLYFKRGTALELIVLAQGAKRKQWNKEMGLDKAVGKIHPTISDTFTYYLANNPTQNDVSLPKLFNEITKYHTNWRKEGAIIAAIAIDQSQRNFCETPYFIPVKYEQINKDAIAPQKPAGFLTGENQNGNIPQNRIFREDVAELQRNRGQRQPRRRQDNPNQMVIHTPEPSKPVISYGPDPEKTPEGAFLQYKLIGYYKEGDDTFHAVADPQSSEYQAFFQEYPYLTVTSVNDLKNFQQFVQDQNKIILDQQSAEEQKYRISFQTANGSNGKENQFMFSIRGAKVVEAFFNIFLEYLKKNNLGNIELIGNNKTLTLPQQQSLKAQFFSAFLKHLKQNSIVDDVEDIIQHGGTDTIGYNFCLKQALYATNEKQIELMDRFEWKMQTQYSVSPTIKEINKETSIHYVSYRVDPKHISNEIIQILICEVLQLVLKNENAMEVDNMPISTASMFAGNNTEAPLPGSFSHDQKDDLLETLVLNLFGQNDQQHFILTKLHYLLSCSENDLWWTAVLRAAASYLRQEQTTGSDAENKLFNFQREKFMEIFEIKNMDHSLKQYTDMLKQTLGLTTEERKKRFNEGITAILRNYLREAPIGTRIEPQIEQACLLMDSMKTEAEKMRAAAPRV